MSPLPPPEELDSPINSEWANWILKKLYAFHAQAQSNATSLGQQENMTAFFQAVSEMPNGSLILRELISQHFIPPNVTAPTEIGQADLAFHCENSNGATKDEVLLAGKISFWIEAFLQSFVAIIGIISNFTAMGVLATSRRRLCSVFNSILSCLLFLHTLYIMTTMVLVLRMWTQSFVLDFLFTHFLYPLKPMLLHASTFLTVVMARERYKAIRHPLEYRNATAGISPWRAASSYLMPVLGLSMLFVSPLYFESKLIAVHQHLSQSAPNGARQLVNVTRHELHVTDFRLNSHYIMWYKNVATLIITILVPLCFIARWNWNTYSVIKRRQRLKNRPQLNLKACLAKEEEAKKARILFVIVFIFVMCNLLRVILNIEETISMRAYQNAAKEGCNSVPLWALVMNTCSQFLLTLNATCGVLIYCAMSVDFRHQLVKKFQLIQAKILRKCPCDTLPPPDDSISAVMGNMSARRSVVYDLVNGIGVGAQGRYFASADRSLIHQPNLSRTSLRTSSRNSEYTPHNSGSSSLNSDLFQTIGISSVDLQRGCDDSDQVDGSSLILEEEEDEGPLAVTRKLKWREDRDKNCHQARAPHPPPQARKKHTFVTVMVH